MKKILVSLLADAMLVGVASSTSAHGGWRGGYGGYGGHVVGGVAVGFRLLWGQLLALLLLMHITGLHLTITRLKQPFCPENGLYYPQMQACPSGWQRVNY
ncbi:hypothetical protein [Polynucleobacter necessarius]|uniref:hypothetical protein n=1 Tax=Polynucleobacter necessarius TaxID=576610 RepID=UPI000E095F55|nr:hypothetical protein [Polynucleobacter necessarius]